MNSPYSNVGRALDVDHELIVIVVTILLFPRKSTQHFTLLRTSAEAHSNNQAGIITVQLSIAHVYRLRMNNVGEMSRLIICNIIEILRKLKAPFILLNFQFAQIFNQILRKIIIS